MARRPPAGTPAARDTIAFRWRDGALLAVAEPHRVLPQDMLHVDRQKAELTANTRQFVERRPANHALLTGARGTGKSSLGALDGDIEAAPENVLIYATSNRRHLMPEYQRENEEYRWVEGELHPGDSAEEKISLSERFGLWLSFPPFDQEQYVALVAHHLKRLGGKSSKEAEAEALRWALTRASRSGRVAMQFARDWVGRNA